MRRPLILCVSLCGIISKLFGLREFVKLPSSWPPARVGGGSDLKLLTPDPAGPADPVVSSQNGVFIVRVVILGLDGALA